MFGKLACTIAILAAAISLHAQNAVDDIEKAKREFGEARYEVSLSTLDTIEQNLRVLGADEARHKLAPALTFYRAADYAMLGARVDAVAAFEEFLKLAPGTSVDPGAYPKAVLSAFAEARKKQGGPAPQAASGRESGIEAAYAAFRPAGPVSETDPHGDLTRGPLADLLTTQERRDWDTLTTEADRAASVVKFWAVRDPAPGTRDNRFRTEIDKRIAFADAQFRQGETRGSMTDRGQVFLLLGPPSYIGRKPLSAADDPTVRQQGNDVAPLPPFPTAQMVAEHNRALDNNPTLNYSAQPNYREIWHYRTLPAGVPAHSADFDFVTKQGAGRQQLARTPEALRVLDSAKKVLAPLASE